jgi:hypothetical protein
MAQIVGTVPILSHQIQNSENRPIFDIVRGCIQATLESISYGKKQQSEKKYRNGVGA